MPPKHRKSQATLASDESVTVGRSLRPRTHREYDFSMRGTGSFKAPPCVQTSLQKRIHHKSSCSKEHAAKRRKSALSQPSKKVASRPLAEHGRFLRPRTQREYDYSKTGTSCFKPSHIPEDDATMEGDQSRMHTPESDATHADTTNSHAHAVPASSQMSDAENISPQQEAVLNGNLAGEQANVAPETKRKSNEDDLKSSEILGSDSETSDKDDDESQSKQIPSAVLHQFRKPTLSQSRVQGLRIDSKTAPPMREDDSQAHPRDPEDYSSTGNDPGRPLVLWSQQRPVQTQRQHLLKVLRRPIPPLLRTKSNP